MASGPNLDDATIEAILRGDEVAPEHRDLAMFAAMVRSVADRPPPRPSPALARLLEGEPPDSRVLHRRRGRTPGHVRHRERRRRRRVLAKVAESGIAAKVSLAFAAAAAVAGIGVAGMLPDPAGSAVRDAIDVLSPLDFSPSDDRPPVGSPRPERPASTEGSTTTGATPRTTVRSADGEDDWSRDSDGAGQSRSDGGRERQRDSDDGDDDDGDGDGRGNDSGSGSPSDPWDAPTGGTDGDYGDDSPYAGAGDVPDDVPDPDDGGANPSTSQLAAPTTTSMTTTGDAPARPGTTAPGRTSEARSSTRTTSPPEDDGTGGQ
jgi:hypothetical protein